MRPDLAYALGKVKLGQEMRKSAEYHERANIRSFRYLVGTIDNGIIMVIGTQDWEGKRSLQLASWRYHVLNHSKGEFKVNSSIPGFAEGYGLTVLMCSLLCGVHLDAEVFFIFFFTIATKCHVVAHNE